MFEIVALFLKRITKEVKGYVKARQHSKQIQEDRKKKFGSTAGRRWRVGSGSVVDSKNFYTVLNVEKLVKNSKATFTLSVGNSKQPSFIFAFFLLVCTFFIIRKIF